MGDFKLRKHQKEQNKEVLKKLKKYDHVIYGAPTGFGKSVVAYKIIEKYIKNAKRVLLMAPRINLVYQLAETCKSLSPSIVQGSNQIGNPVLESQLVISIPQTVNRRLVSERYYFGMFDLVIVDECHLFFDIIGGEPTKGVKNIYDRYWDTAKWIGFSATPISADGNRLSGWDYSVYKYDTAWLIKHGWLAKFNYFAEDSIDKSNIKVNRLTHEYTVSDMESVTNNASAIESVFKAWEKYAKDEKCIIFAASIDHAKLIVDYFSKEKRIYANAVHSKLGKRQLNWIMEEFDKDILKIMVNVDMLTTGFDDPSVSTIILARPIGSVRTAIQIYGRVLRKHDDIPVVNIVDLCGVHESTVLPDEPINWNKAKKEVNVNVDTANSSEIHFVCPSCNVTSPLNKRRFERFYKNDRMSITYFCPNCGDVVDENVTELVEVENMKQVKTISNVDTSKKYDYLNVVREIILKKNKKNSFVKPTNPNFAYYIHRSGIRKDKKKYKNTIRAYKQNIYSLDKTWKILKDIHFG